jgi:hypothetical protein
MPYIIDYGRSHIEPSKAFTYENYYADDNNRSYKSFDTDQNRLWENNTRYTVKKQETITKINNLINQIREQKGYLPTNQTILDQYYYLIPGTEHIYPFKPDVFNSKHDFYRLTRSINSLFLNVQNSLPISSFWNTLDTLLLNSYPFYIPNSYVLPKSYPSFTNKFNTAIEIAKYIHNILNLNTNIPSQKVPYTFNQIAGGKIKTEKIKYTKYKPYRLEYTMSSLKNKKQIEKQETQQQQQHSSIIQSVYKIDKTNKTILYNNLYKQLDKNKDNKNISKLQIHNIDNYSEIEHFSFLPEE